MKDLLPKLLLFFAVVTLSFTYGFVSNWKQVFPYQTIREAYLAMNALIDLDGAGDLPGSVDFWDESGLTEPLVTTLATNAGKENIFILGNDQAVYDGSSGSALLAWITDRDGSIQHAWRQPNEDIWSPLENRDAVGQVWGSYPVGSHLYPNGDILVSYQGIDVFPFAMGIAKFDKDSNLIWKRNGFYHHWFSVDSDGYIYVPDLKMVTSPLKIDDHKKYLVCEDGTFAYDVISVLDQSGEKIREIDVLESIIESDLAGLLNSNKQQQEEIETCDPTHLNDVRVLSEEVAGEFPDFSQGDLLISLRSLNTVGVLDKDTNLFKWFYVGSAHHQHSPRYGRNGHVFLFDNYGGRESRGISRVLSVDVNTRMSQAVFPRNGVRLPTRAFHSDTAGHMDLNLTGDRVLVSFTHQGLVWEVDIEKGEIVWEFVNTHLVDGRPARVGVYSASYVGEVDFAMNGGRFD
ncbi:MAG: hypothetical protein OEU36_18355 [Gammaproteobacteria bacterium]|nr:hypothetical protein [Gammaproteobacteria bacterium]